MKRLGRATSRAIDSTRADAARGWHRGHLHRTGDARSTQRRGVGPLRTRRIRPARCAVRATFVHIGDCHMAPGPRNEDRWGAVDQIVRENLTREHLAGWLIPGDLNHGRMSIDDRERLGGTAHSDGDRRARGHLPRNHDLPGDLDVFARLGSTWPIRVVDSPCVLPLACRTVRSRWRSCCRIHHRRISSRAASPQPTSAIPCTRN